jgi:cytochrome b involved in lipid metabolism
MSGVTLCINNIFNNYDFNNMPIYKHIFEKHNKKENPWISIDHIVYSIQQEDTILLDLFKDYYGKDVKEFILSHELFKNMKKRILILEKLKERKIGYIKSVDQNSKIKVKK